MFRYDPESGAVVQPTGTLLEGAAPSGGYRGGLAMQGDGNGIRLTELSGGTGQTDIYRVTLDGDALKTEAQWSGMMDAIPAELALIEIEWHEADDLSALDSWTPGEAPLPGAGTESLLPEDGNRLVLTGTLNEYSYDEVAAMAGNYPGNDYERQLYPTFWLIVLDEPRTIEIMSGAGPDLYSSEASMICATDPAGLEQYAGRHVTFSVDPNRTFWPSDASLPLGQPRTGDIHILQ